VRFIVDPPEVVFYRPQLLRLISPAPSSPASCGGIDPSLLPMLQVMLLYHGVR